MNNLPARGEVSEPDSKAARSILGRVGDVSRRSVHSAFEFISADQRVAATLDGRVKYFTPSPPLHSAHHPEDMRRNAAASPRKRYSDQD